MLANCGQHILHARWIFWKLAYLQFPEHHSWFDATSSHRLRESDTYSSFRDGLYLLSKDGCGGFLSHELTNDYEMESHVEFAGVCSMAI